MSERWRQRLRSYRERAKLTQKELAERVGVAEMTLRKWESLTGNPESQRTPDIEMLYKIAEAVGCKPGDLL
jgi:transcriptional regulator with XRE-family HTH domain